MPKGALGHVAKPASEQAVAERWNTECTLQEQIPKVYRNCCANTDNNGTEDDVCLNAHDQSCPLAAKADASMARARARPPRPPIATAMLLHVRRSGWRYRPRMARTKPAASMIRTTTSPNAAMPSKVTVTETAPRLPAMAPISTRAKHASTPRKPLRISLVEVSTALGLPGSSRGLRFAAAVSRCALLGAWATCTTALLEVHAPGRIRTSDQQLRRLLLYPPELRARVIRQQLNTRCHTKGAAGGA